MTRLVAAFVLLLTAVAWLVPAPVVISAEAPESEGKMYSAVQTYLGERAKEFSQIPEERRADLQKIARYVQSRIQSGEPARLTFICTHNSRRSHLSQIWAATSAGFYGIADVDVYSGGTEATAFNPRAIAATERAGLKVKKTDDSKNPRYEVRFQDTEKPLICYSKVYSEAPNPKADFCAVMTCSQADASCPIVTGSSLRVPLFFDDPKVADGTPEESATYDERCRQISREMLYLFSRVGN
jgi:protein-tyrosine-phosphatase